MEKVLRKVSIYNYLPENRGEYVVVRKDGIKTVFPFNDDNNWDVEDLDNLNIEYWYEEVSVDELEDYQIAVGNLQMIIEVDIFKAKERYEKALFYIEDHLGDEHCYVEFIEAALKIATGIKEDKV